MKFTHCTQEQIHQALAKVNKKYEGNITFNRCEHPNYTLKVRSLDKPGYRRHRRYSLNGLVSDRRSRHACWHVHGDFFDALFEICPNAVVRAAEHKITAWAGNWEDWNLGTNLLPIYMSKSCDCDR